MNITGGIVNDEVNYRRAAFGIGVLLIAWGSVAFAFVKMAEILVR